MSPKPRGCAQRPTNWFTAFAWNRPFALSLRNDQVIGTDSHPDVCAPTLCSSGVPQREGGVKVLAAVAGPRVPRGGVTRHGVVLTDLQSLIDCQ